ncbi:hypothetical protein SELMODRAFT_425223 [Selaginella moellendorffii]|uniref:Uncharacterized protein n=1 Tax=Selaginella moellendorffii TaxID=88036 RepID=D8SSE7_SELML|nr:hypothetical protein SELMODRAFT_425223 [Selaginella moellendorffii]
MSETEALLLMLSNGDIILCVPIKNQLSLRNQTLQLLHGYNKLNDNFKEMETTRNDWEPYVEQTSEFSLAQLWITSNKLGPVNTIEANSSVSILNLEEVGLDSLSTGQPMATLILDAITCTDSRPGKHNDTLEVTMIKKMEQDTQRLIWEVENFHPRDMALAVPEKCKGIPDLAKLISLYWFNAPAHSRLMDDTLVTGSLEDAKIFFNGMPDKNLIWTTMITAYIPTRVSVPWISREETVAAMGWNDARKDRNAASTSGASARLSRSLEIATPVTSPVLMRMSYIFIDLCSGARLKTLMPAHLVQIVLLIILIGKRLSAVHNHYTRLLELPIPSKGRRKVKLLTLERIDVVFVVCLAPYISLEGNALLAVFAWVMASHFAMFDVFGTQWAFSLTSSLVYRIYVCRFQVRFISLELWILKGNASFYFATALAYTFVQWNE